MTQNRQQRRAAAANPAPRIEMSDDLKARWAEFGVDDVAIQYNYQQARASDPSLTDEDFIERAAHDLQQLEKGREDARIAEAKERELQDARERQANRIALAGMALPAIITAADHTKSVRDVARAALAHADALLYAAEATKDPILNN